MLSFHFKTEVYFGLSMDWLDQLNAELNLLNAFARFKPAKTSRVFFVCDCMLCACYTVESFSNMRISLNMYVIDH